MARARIIKPGFFKNENLVECSFETRLLFAGLWTLADRAGRLEDRPKKIKMEIFPGDDVDCDKLLNELSAHQFIKRYQIDGNKYIQINAFSAHQKPHKKEVESVIPEPGKAQPKSGKAKPKSDEPGLNLNPDTLTLNLNPESISADFEIFWSEYPKTRPKGNKTEAKEKFFKILTEGVTADELTAAAKNYRAFCDDGNYNQHAITWLNQRGWETDWSEQLGRGTGSSAGKGIQSARTSTSVDDAAERIKRRHGAPGSQADDAQRQSSADRGGDRHTPPMLENPQTLRIEGG